MTISRKPYIVISVYGYVACRRSNSDLCNRECSERIMTTKVEEAAKQDFAAEVSEWIEAFDDVVAQDWEQGAELLGGLGKRQRKAGVPTPSELTTPYHN